MLASVLSCGLTGIDGFGVEVEVNLSNGMPAFEIVGLPDAAVRESRERVRAAAKNSGYGFPTARLTVNLAPADFKKEGPAFDLPIALGTLCCMGVLDARSLADTCAFGELGLDGAVRPVRGALPMVISAIERGISRVMLPADNAKRSPLHRGRPALPGRQPQRRRPPPDRPGAHPAAGTCPLRRAAAPPRIASDLRHVTGSPRQARARDRRRRRAQPADDRPAGLGQDADRALPARPSCRT